jgi:hypothetical protein
MELICKLLVVLIGFPYKIRMSMFGFVKREKLIGIVSNLIKETHLKKEIMISLVLE